MEKSTPVKVLVVDDDSEIREALLAFLQEEGYQAQGASSGRAALQILTQEGGWIVFLDWMMPGVDGRAVVEALHNQPELRAANQFILMSATARWRMEDARLAAGVFVGALPKPFDLDEVEALLHRLRPEEPPESDPPGL
ncbi:MAG TPA: response regulator [Ktedonobacterales bacterium]